MQPLLSDNKMMGAYLSMAASNVQKICAFKVVRCFLNRNLSLLQSKLSYKFSQNGELRWMETLGRHCKYIPIPMLPVRPSTGKRSHYLFFCDSYSITIPKGIHQDSLWDFTQMNVRKSVENSQ